LINDVFVIGLDDCAFLAKWLTGTAPDAIISNLVNHLYFLFRQ
jgi:hypothetical protein